MIFKIDKNDMKNWIWNCQFIFKMYKKIKNDCCNLDKNEKEEYKESLKHEWKKTKNMEFYHWIVSSELSKYYKTEKIELSNIQKLIYNIFFNYSNFNSLVDIIFLSNELNDVIYQILPII